MRFQNGFLVLGRLRGAPVRVHWTMPLGMFILSGFSFEAGPWVGIFALILLHEIGHAIAVKAYRLSVVSIDVHGAGGECAWAGYATPRQEAVIAWGGVLAQAVVLLATLALAPLLRPAPGSFLGELTHTLVATNLFLIALNLLPVGNFDGKKAWTLFRFDVKGFFRRRALAKKAKEAQKARSHLRVVEAPEDPDEVPPVPDEVKKVLDEILKREAASRGKKTLN